MVYKQGRRRTGACDGFAAYRSVMAYGRVVSAALRLRLHINRTVVGS